MIKTSALTKHFATYKKQPGFLGSLSSMINRQRTLNTAVESFDLEVKQGELIGLLGPNGAGKTTLMKMLTGIIVPSSGELEVAGHTPADRAMDFRRQIALVMGQKSQLWWDIPSMDSFILLQKYYELSKSDFDARLEELVTLLQVKDKLNIHVRKLSLGERMKMELIACLLHRPRVIFLDEPTIGLDVIAQQNIRKFIAQYHKDHQPAIVLTSHYMADVEALCSRIVLIIGGRKRFDGPIKEFAGILGREKNVTFFFESPPPQNDNIWQKLYPQWDQSGQKVDLRIAEKELRPICSQILQRFAVSDFQTEKMPIERVMSALLSNPELSIEMNHGR